MRFLIPLLLLVGTASAEVVAAKPVPRGTVLTEAHLEGNGEDLSVYLGMAAKRPLMAGRTVRLRDIEEPEAVRRQSGVTLVFRRGPLLLTTEGRALTGGRVGDVIDVSLSGRRRPLSATVIDHGRAEVRG